MTYKTARFITDIGSEIDLNWGHTDKQIDYNKTTITWYSKNRVKTETKTFDCDIDLMVTTLLEKGYRLVDAIELPG